MKGNPKFKYNDVVSYKINDDTIIGSVAIIDAYGTFEDDSDVSYDILSDDCLYKHIPEKIITKYEQ